MIAVNYGGGTNSTALLIEAVNRGVKVDVCIFADTGSERPETYTYVALFAEWLWDHGIQLDVRRWHRSMTSKTRNGSLVGVKGEFVPLHVWCERTKSLPSKAYGLSGCTSKWKQQVADAAVKTHPAVVAEHAAGHPVERWIGYDADEPERADRMLRKNPKPELWAWRAPLMEWDMGRQECEAIIRAAGLPLPGKSACWLCPSMTQPEIDALGVEHPELLQRALDIEREAVAAGNAGTGESRKGLGGRLNWNDYVNGKKSEETSFADMECGCYDG